MLLSLIAAVAENGVIGRDGQLPWHLSADLQRFKRITTGHAILMGRLTYDSIGRPLPRRTSIVITRNADFEPGHDGVLVAANLDDALAKARQADTSGDEAFVIGGARIYEMTFPRADRFYLTRVHADVEGDVYFPAVDWDQWRLLEEQRHEGDEKNDHSHTACVFERV